MYGSRAKANELALDRTAIYPTDEKGANVEVYRFVNKLKEFMCDGFYLLCEAFSHSLIKVLSFHNYRGY